MKKIFICLLTLLFTTVSGYAEESDSIKDAYKNINSFCKIQNIKELDNFINSNPYSKKAIIENDDKLMSTCIKNKCNDEVFNVLIKNGLDVNKLDNAPLIYAIKKNNVDAVRVLIENGVDVNKWYPRKDMALVYAAKKGNPEIIKLLIDAKAKVDVTDNKQNTPLLLLCKKSPNSQGVYYLLDAGADLFKLNKYDVSAYMVLPSNKKSEILDYYNKSMSKLLSDKFVAKNKKYVAEVYGVPDKKISLDNNSESWEYLNENQHYIQLRSSSNGLANYSSYKASSSYINTSRYSTVDTQYYGGFTIKVEKKTIFNFKDNNVSSVKYVSSFNTYR